MFIKVYWTFRAISLAKAGSIFNITIAKDCKTAKVSSLNSMPRLKSITRAIPGQCARLSSIENEQFHYSPSRSYNYFPLVNIQKTIENGHL
jgi:hypothetical protein